MVVRDTAGQSSIVGQHAIWFYAANIYTGILI